MPISENDVKHLGHTNDIRSSKRKARKQTIKIIPVESFSGNDIKSIRVKYLLTQTILAQILGVSARTVEAWELGINEPSGPARRMLSLIKDDESFIKNYYLIVQNKEESL